MMPAFLHVRRSRVLLVLAALALILVACGGDDDDEPAAGRLSAADAARIADAALLQIDDLPAAPPWTREAPDDDEDDDDAEIFAGIPACSDLRDLVERFGDEGGELAERELGFEAEVSELSRLMVETDVSVYATAEEVEAGRPVARAVFASDDLATCLREAMEALLTADPDIPLQIESIEVGPRDALEPGLGLHMDMAAAVLGIPLDIELDILFVPEGNVVGQLLMLQLNSGELTEALPGLLERFRERIRDAQS